MLHLPMIMSSQIIEITPPKWPVPYPADSSLISIRLTGSSDLKTHAPFTFASRTLTASGPLFGGPFGLGIASPPFSLGLTGESISWFKVPFCPLIKSGVLGLVAMNYWQISTDILSFREEYIRYWQHSRAQSKNSAQHLRECQHPKPFDSILQQCIRCNSQL